MEITLLTIDFDEISMPKCAIYYKKECQIDSKFIKRRRVAVRN